MKLQKEFYLNKDVVEVAKALLGKKLCTSVDGYFREALIVETEAYSYQEKGCHAYNKRHTKRTATMFQEGGVAYIYLCYGIHHLFNVVTNEEGEPEAVLMRAIAPLDYSSTFINRPSGPGKLTKAMNISTVQNGISVEGNEIWIEEGLEISKIDIITSKRIGIEYAEEDADLPWRFYIKGNKYVSRP